MISESDWKKFKKIKEAALERFCGTILQDVSEGLASRDMPTNHEKYLYLYKLIENYDKRIALLFDGHSRSKATLQLMMLRKEGLVDESDIQGLSNELKENINPENHG
ncbi:hypothetical protein [Thiohalophilus sp.]|uniref:hypothetical protein n=1 Tax=Thiohalophilus sp. TaxID=3028392 RepID=UPI002ACE7F26|nr:hypothetical protein [Thiohalophilus sp.]MDZ7661883.1 hypothetical protein [Thiohalophilus sp.]MDZ7803748.1 hypothetical protein [Thiohalophilus sp.]